MGADIDDPMHINVYTTNDGRAVIERSNASVVLLSADQILTIISELHACYGYCYFAARRIPAHERERAIDAEI